MKLCPKCSIKWDGKIGTKYKHIEMKKITRRLELLDPVRGGYPTSNFDPLDYKFDVYVCPECGYSELYKV